MCCVVAIILALPFYTPCCTIVSYCTFIHILSSRLPYDHSANSVFPIPARCVIYSSGFYRKPNGHHAMFYPQTRISETVNHTETEPYSHSLKMMPRSKRYWNTAEVERGDF
jgi:hypothetical protein